MLKPSSYVPVLVFSSVCAIGTWAGLSLTGNVFTWHFAFLLGYFTLVTIGLLFWQEGSVKQTNMFIRRFMAGLVIKLMGSLVLLAVLLKISPDLVDKPLTVVFAILYLAYLAFSTVRLSTVLRPAKN